MNWIVNKNVNFVKFVLFKELRKCYIFIKIIFLAKRELEFTTKFAIAPNVCWQMFLF